VRVSLQTKFVPSPSPWSWAHQVGLTGLQRGVRVPLLGVWVLVLLVRVVLLLLLLVQVVVVLLLLLLLLLLVRQGVIVAGAVHALVFVMPCLAPDAIVCAGVGRAWHAKALQHGGQAVLAATHLRGVGLCK